MVFINEWLPNPTGADAKGEFIEIFNNGNAPVNLGGWTIKTTGKKTFSLGARTIGSRGYLVLTHAETKLSLKNTGEMVSLYDSLGHLQDQSTYLGAAPSGQSFSRVYYPVPGASTPSAGASSAADAAAVPQSFAWGTPTPGAANKVDLHNGISAVSYPFGAPINIFSPPGAEVLGAFLGVGAILAVLVVYCLKSHEDIAKLFFSGNG